MGDLHVRHDGFFLGSGSGMEGFQVLMESRCALAESASRKSWRRRLACAPFTRSM